MFYGLLNDQVQQMLVPSEDSVRSAAAGFLLAVSLGFAIVRMLASWSRYESGSRDWWDVRSFAGRPMTPFWSRSLAVFASMSAALAVVLWPVLSDQMELWHDLVLNRFLWHPVTLTVAEVLLIAATSLAVMIPATIALFCLQRDASPGSTWNTQVTGCAWLGLGGGMILTTLGQSGTMPCALAFLACAVTLLMVPERIETNVVNHGFAANNRVTKWLWSSAAIIALVSAGVVRSESGPPGQWLIIGLSFGWIVGARISCWLHGWKLVLASAAVLAPAMIATIKDSNSLIGLWTFSIAAGFWGVLLGGLRSRINLGEVRPAWQGVRTWVYWPAVAAVVFITAGFHLPAIPPTATRESAEPILDIRGFNLDDTCLILGEIVPESIDQLADSGAEFTQIEWPTTMTPSPARLVRAMQSKYTAILLAEPPGRFSIGEADSRRFAGWLADRLTTDGDISAEVNPAAKLADLTQRIHANRKSQDISE
jgi:hypothetical protein